MSAARWARAAPSAIASETSAPASTGASLSAVTNHRHDVALRLQLRTRAQLLLGQLPRRRVARYPAAPRRPARPRLESPLQNSTAMPCRAASRRQRAASARQVSWITKRANGRACRRQARPRHRPRDWPRSRLGRCASRWPSMRPSIPGPAVPRTSIASTASVASGQRQRHRMAAVALQRRGNLQQRARDPSRRTLQLPSSAGCPVLSVPVLSNTTRSTRASVVSASGRRPSTPSLQARRGRRSTRRESPARGRKGN